ncbi:MAG: hypothetical protein ABIJ61_12290 [bacterium]
MYKWTLIVLVVGALFANSGNAQTTLNPDISLLGQISAFTHNDGDRPLERNKFNLTSPNMELIATGYLNPYARATGVLSWEGENNAEVEELYATVERGLPLGANLRVGKSLLEFGRLNPTHAHAYSFIKRPLPHEALFGDEGLNDMAIRGSFLLPTGNAYTELMVGLLKGDIFAPNEQAQESDVAEEEAGEETESRPDLGFFGRLATSFAVSESAELALGGSVLNAVHGFAPDAEDETVGNPEQLRSWLIGGDLKYKYRPDRYTTLQIEAEGIVRIDGQGTGNSNSTSSGAYGYLDYRFHQRYNFGGIVEWVRIETPTESETATTQTDTWRLGLFVGWAPIEETSLLRLVGHWTEPENSDGYWELTLQFVFSLGPHQPHNF